MTMSSTHVDVGRFHFQPSNKGNNIVTVFAKGGAEREGKYKKNRTKREGQSLSSGVDSQTNGHGCHARGRRRNTAHGKATGSRYCLSITMRQKKKREDSHGLVVNPRAADPAPLGGHPAQRHAAAQSNIRYSASLNTSPDELILQVAVNYDVKAWSEEPTVEEPCHPK